MHCIFAQRTPLDPTTAVEWLREDVAELVAKYPSAHMLVFPEVYLFGGAELSGNEATWYRALAEPIPGPRTETLGRIARDHGVWLIPGSLPELGDNGGLFNTAVAFSPDGVLSDAYRKVFPWRPSEPWTAGTTFSAFDIPLTGRVGFNICYDSWYPEATRQIAWMGAEAVFNLVKTTTPDREQELVLARANAITNQVFYWLVLGLAYLAFLIRGFRKEPPEISKAHA